MTMRQCDGQSDRQSHTVTIVRKGSFFQRFDLTLKALIDFLYYWSTEFPTDGGPPCRGGGAYRLRGS